MTADTQAAVIRAEIVSEPIALTTYEQLVAEAAGGAAGAIVGFVGAVRDHDHDRDVVALGYSAHPSAPAVIAEVLAEVAGEARGVRAIAAAHRIGDLVVGDVAFVVAVAADHRAEAFGTCALAVDEVKRRLPVWKHQIFADGDDEWVGSA
ncbi:molybdenum cofactor biosynthesis protein MoaE [Gordonia jinhuaensis]|uniref:Molybdenum cofactor biosynthesis protein MoaE n=1 Tax=Gordonia jinhuaensis TaxID=1517702 RepID=A0A916TC23_9ACTN|nr:molybdenum cofactor biosynthesis protein MoaE [Gordonia jinhuaensis]GGB37642.1 molybdenum cofactor biosynthesis protein MoaE [Gordonia jinhuaensis]